MITSFSQTMLNEYERCAWRFKQLYIDCPPEASGNTSLAMETGTAFDAYARCALDRNLSLDQELIQRDGTPVRERAVELGRFLFLKYEACGALAALRLDGVAVLSYKKQVMLGDVPYDGTPDVILHDGTVIDWKTSGVTSQRGASPKPGYEKMWTLMPRADRWLETGKHAQYGMLLEDIDKKWATQVTLYSFLMGKPLGASMKAGIDAIFVNRDQIHIIRYRTRISEAFQYQTWNRLQKAWREINGGNFPHPFYHERKCNMWGRLCEVASICPAYQATQTGPEWMKQMTY